MEANLLRHNGLFGRKWPIPAIPAPQGRPLTADPHCRSGWNSSAKGAAGHADSTRHDDAADAHHGAHRGESGRRITRAEGHVGPGRTKWRRPYLPNGGPYRSTLLNSKPHPANWQARDTPENA